MKKILLFFMFLALCLTTITAQTPQSIPYQAVARNSAGNLLVNQSVGLRFTIRESSGSGTIDYQETQTATTNGLGLFSVNIGAGAVVTGTFSSVPWGNGVAKFTQVEIDPNGGTSYTNLGAAQMMSVPYALYSGSASSVPLTAGSGIAVSGDQVSESLPFTSLTTSGNSGAATISGGVLNIPNHTLAGLGLAAGSGIGISGGTVSESLPFTSLTTTGTNGSASISSGVLNIPTYTLAGLGGIGLSGLSASSPLSYNNTTGVFSLGTVPVANGGTGLTGTPGNGALNIGNGSGFTRATLTSGSGITVSNGSGSISIAESLPITSFTTSGSSGAASISSGVLNIPAYTLAGLGGIGLSALSASSPLSYSSGAFSISQAGTSANGYLSSTDWNTFNNKIGGGGTSGQMAFFNGTGTITSGSGNTWNNTNGTQNITSTALTANPALILTQQTQNTNYGGWEALQIQNTGFWTGAGCGIGFYNIGTTEETGKILSNEITGTTGNMTFYTLQNGSLTQALQLDQTGKTITSKFQMTSGASNGYILQSDGSGNASWVVGGPTGSGTSGYTARWTGSSNLGTGAIQDNGSQVGIGASPNSSYGLYVNGNILANTTYNTQSSYGKIVQIGDDAWLNDVNIANTMGIIGNENGAYGGLTLGTGGNYFYSNGTANIGVSTTAPAYTFDVSGNLRSTAASYLATGGGNVGIGTTGPNNTLTINGSGGMWNSNQFNFYTDGGSTPRGFVGQNTSGGSSDFMLAATGSGQWMRIGANNSSIAFFPDNSIYSGASPKMIILSSGNVGINNTNPGYLLDIGTATGSYSGQYEYITSTGLGNTGGSGNTGSIPVSIHTAGRIFCGGEFDVISDRRVKTDIKAQETNALLDLARKMHVVNYTYIDKLEKGGKVKTGFIAQDLEQVVPNMVNNNDQNYIPNVFELAERFSVSDNVLTVTTTKSNEFAKGDEIKLFGKENKVYEVKVSDVLTPNTFTVNGWKENEDQLFVYGKKVYDFRDVDFNQLTSLAIGAIQELDKKIIKLENENAGLKQDLKSTDFRYNQLKTQVETLQELMEKNGIRGSK